MNDMSTKKINTSVLPGFMELLPPQQMAFNRMKSVIIDTFEQFGFLPLDTPVIERAEVLLAKAGGETERQIYQFTKGDTSLALRFDLTVPLARYVSEHAREITFPFRRYHVGKVYRGESPQKGRFREFYQCDIDIIGREKLSLVNDAEIPSVIYKVFKRLDIGQFVIRISNRKILKGLLEGLNISTDKSVEVMRIIDKIDKVGKGSVEKMMVDLGIENDTITKIFHFLDISGNTDEIIRALEAMDIQNVQYRQGVDELSQVVTNVGKLGIPVSNYAIDLSIARGLDYYTGTVYETVLSEYPEIGSVCSGGRYDNLAEMYTEQKLPGVGISIGLTRLFYQLSEAGLIKTDSSTPTKVLVVPFVSDLSQPLSIATRLREAGIATEVYLEEDRMKNKLAYADKLGIPFVVIIGEDEIEKGEFSVKNMRNGKQTQVKADELLAYIESEGSK